MTFLIRPHRAESLNRPQILYCYDDNKLKEYTGYTHITNPSEIVGAKYDYIVIALDGSFNQDATGLVVATISARPHLDVVGLWEPPLGDEDFRVPVADVEEAIRTACRRWSVREVIADPFRWTRTLQALEAEGLPMVEFPQSPQRMTPATVGIRAVSSSQFSENSFHAALSSGRSTRPAVCSRFHSANVNSS